MTKEHEASRTLVKSPPELWAECSDPGSLARHLGEFGDITITRLEPESAVAWEGEHASGTVRIEPSGWGTRVTLTAQTEGEVPEASPDTEPVAEAEPALSDPDDQPGEEEEDAEMEETAEDSEELPLADSPRARARWRRMTARLRSIFGGAETSELAETPEPPDGPEDPTEPGEPEELMASVPPPEPVVQPDPELRTEPESEAEPALETQPEPAEPPAADPSAAELDAEAILASALDSLGQAHHRPFSRA